MVKVQDQVYHFTGSLLPDSGEEPKFLQIYSAGDGEMGNWEVDIRHRHLKKKLFLICRKCCISIIIM